MYAQVEKPKENESRVIANSVTQKKSNVKQGFGFVDNRSEAFAQRKLQAQEHNSPIAFQLSVFNDMANNNSVAKQTAQLQSIANRHSTDQQQPNTLETGVENLSSLSLNGVKGNRNFDVPAQLRANADASGTGINVASDNIVIQMRKYFHGRSENRDEVAQPPKKIKDFYARKALDFDPVDTSGFYMAHKYGVSSNWASTRAARYRDHAKETGQINAHTRPIPTVYTYDVDDKALEPLIGYSWAMKQKSQEDEAIDFASKEGSEDWQKFVLRSRENRNDHRADYVRGPMISNPTVTGKIVRSKTSEKGDTLDLNELDAIATEHVRWDPHADQTAIYSDKAKDIFDSGLKRREILPFIDPEFNKVEEANEIVSIGNRAEIGRVRLEKPELESTSVLENYRQNLRTGIVRRFVSEFDESVAQALSNILLEYEALGDLKDTKLSLEILAIDKLLPENQEYLDDMPKFEDYTMAESDFRVMSKLLSNRALEVAKKIGWKNPEPFLKISQSDFVTAYNIHRTIVEAKTPYLPDFETLALGPLLGIGKKKIAFEIKGFPNLVMAKMKVKDQFRVIGNEIGMLAILKGLGLPVIEVVGITLHGGLPAIVMPRMAEQSKDFKAEKVDEVPVEGVPEGKMLRGGDKLIDKSHFMTSDTLKQLIAIQEGLLKAKVRVSDLQFLIDEKGTIVIADPRKVQLGVSPSSGNIGTINHILAAGVLKILELQTPLPSKSESSYQQIFGIVCKLTGLFPKASQVDDILYILQSKYEVRLIGDDNEGIAERRKLSVEKPIVDKGKSVEDGDIPKASDESQWKETVLRVLNESSTLQIPPKYTVSMKYVKVTDSKDDVVTNKIFGLTSQQFFEAFKKLNNKTDQKITYDKTGIYLLPSN